MRFQIISHAVVACLLLFIIFPLIYYISSVCVSCYLLLLLVTRSFLPRLGFCYTTHVFGVKELKKKALLLRLFSIFWLTLIFQIYRLAITFQMGQINVLIGIFFFFIFYLSKLEMKVCCIVCRFIVRSRGRPYCFSYNVYRSSGFNSL